MRTLSLLCLSVLTCSSLFAGPVELYVNNSLVKIYYDEQALRYSSVQILTSQDTNQINISIMENYNREANGKDYASSFVRKLRLYKAKGAFFTQQFHKNAVI
jgi:hypothetical protein